MAAKNRAHSTAMPQGRPSEIPMLGGSLMAVEKTLRLESTKRFPPFHRHDG